MPFPSIPSLVIDSSVNLGMPRNKHFLPRNNGNHSKSILRNFFGTKFRCQPYVGNFLYACMGLRPRDTYCPLAPYIEINCTVVA
jgi:hypothetical protein